LHHAKPRRFINKCTIETLFCDEMRMLPVFVRFDLAFDHEILVQDRSPSLPGARHQTGLFVSFPFNWVRDKAALPLLVNIVWFRRRRI
jgi:hypothetical protein